MTVELSDHDRSMLDGARGEATALAMRILVDMAGVWQADRLIDVTSAHVDSCLYHGRAGLDSPRSSWQEGRTSRSRRP